MKVLVRLRVNGESHEVAVSPHNTLLEVLRNELELTGTKAGCELGSCGACTVLVNGEPFLSCITLALDVGGREITTIEGLNRNGDLHPLQKEFIEAGAVQCGFCTPGMILTAKAILDQKPAPTEEGVRKGMAGNLCRCTGYKKIVSATMTTAQKQGEF